MFTSPSRLILGALGVFALVSTVALTLGVVGLTHVSILPVTSPQTGIAVCGHGKATAKPDQARVQMGVQANAPTAQGARTQAAQAMTAVLASLKTNGVADQDIQTTYFTLQPRYDYNGGTARQNGYTASNTVSATIHTIDKAGSIIDAVAEAGGEMVVVNGIVFSRGDPSQAHIDAQKDAVADAKRQAEQVAASSGAALGAAVSIQVGGCGTTSQPSLNFGADKAGSAPNTPIQPGQLDVTVDVAVVYALR